MIWHDSHCPGTVSYTHLGKRSRAGRSAAPSGPYFLILGIQVSLVDHLVHLTGSCIAVKKGNTELLDHINSVIADVTSSGEMDEMVNQANLDSEY